MAITQYSCTVPSASEYIQRFEEFTTRNGRFYARRGGLHYFIIADDEVIAYASLTPHNEKCTILTHNNYGRYRNLITRAWSLDKVSFTDTGISLKIGHMVVRGGSLVFHG